MRLRMRSLARPILSRDRFFSWRCYLEGGSLDGGDLVSPRCLGPSRSTSEGCGAAHGHRHPAYPLLLRPVISLWGFRFHYSWVLGSAWVFALRQRFFVRFCFALQDPTRVSFVAGVSLSLFSLLSDCSVGWPSSRLSFSPLQALGKHKPRCGLWFPLCSLPGHAPRPRPVRPLPHLHQGIPPALAFVAFWWVAFSASLSLSLSLSFSPV